ncbi:hypothetical protein [Bacillus coahuilensis]|uniref:hypothetical protein n=1 Tax=Bacillus coahuilensis TaxID=408580 RepID=UPI0007512126|nr:hypothetical protein [Bacillus coahuilensis]
MLAACGEEEAKEEEVKVEQAEETAEETTEETTETEAASEATTEVAVQEEITAYQDIKAELEKMKEDQEVNWETVSTLYTDHLQAKINEVDGELAQGIEAFIEAGKSGDVDPNVARQQVDKLTQSYFYKKQKDLQKGTLALMEEGKMEEANSSFEEIKVLASEVFIPTATKRDEYYELTGENSMVENINNGLAVQEEALAAENAEDFAVYLQITDKSIYKSYYLASKSYGEKIGAGIEEGASLEELTEKQAEAYGFLQAIKGSLSGADEEAVTKLNDLFSLTQKADEIDAEEVESLFVQAMKAKSSGYYENTIKVLEEGNLVEAKVDAMEGNMFLSMLAVDLTKANGEEATTALLEKGEAFFEAVASENVEEAKKLKEEIVTEISNL